MLAGIGVMIAIYLMAFSEPNHGVLVLVDEFHEGVAELVMFIVAFLIGAWNLLQDVKLCARYG